jgi:DNA polymerase III sliding clamp (beta) subunit (PCNA family)
MRFRVLTAQLTKHLRVMDRIVPKKGGLPFYHVVNVTVGVDGDVEMWVGNGKELYRVEGITQLLDSYEDGEMAIPAQEFFRAVFAAPTSEVTIIHEGGMGPIRIESGSARWNLELLAGVAKQDWSVESHGQATAVNTQELIEAIEGVRYAASKTEMHPSLQQVHVGEGRVVASDGRRLAQEALNGLPDVLTLDVPERNVDTLLEALSALGDDQVEIEEDDGQIMFGTASGGYVVGRLNYPWPDMDSIVLERARAQEAEVTVPVDGLVTALKVASVAIDEDGAVVLRFTDGVIEVIGESARSEGRMEVRCETRGVPSGTEMRLRASDVLDLLGRITDEQLVLKVGELVYVQGSGMEAAIRPVRA